MPFCKITTRKHPDSDQLWLKLFLLVNLIRLVEHVTYSMIDAWPGQSDVYGVRGRVMVRSEIILSVWIVLHNKVHDRTSLYMKIIKKNKVSFPRAEENGFIIILGPGS